MDLIRLGDIATYINGYAFKPKDWREKGIPIIRIQNLNDPNKEYNYFDGEIDSKYLVNEGDILISWSASIGVYEWRGQQGVLNQHIFKVDFNKIKIDKKYFKYIVSIALNRALQYMHGSTMKHITKQYFDNILIPVPLFDQQVKIANILDQAQELIDKRKAQIKALDELIQSVFYDMFGDPLINEKEWPRKCINEVVDYLKRGKSPKYVDYSNIRVINQKCIYWRKFIDSNCKYYNEDFEDKIKDQYLQDKDILINSTGTGTLGRAVVVNVKEDDKFVVDSHVTLMRVNLYCINPIFIATLFEFNNIQSEIYLKCVNGSTNQIELSVVKLGDYQVIIPPIELQNQFAEIVARIQKQKELLNKSLVELENNFNSLMERAFNGGPLR